MLNGMPVSSDVAVKKIEQDKLIDDVVSGIKYNADRMSDEEIAARVLQATQLISANTGVTDAKEAANIANIIFNKIK